MALIVEKHSSTRPLPLNNEAYTNKFLPFPYKDIPAVDMVLH